MPLPNFRELAQQGDPDAIAALLNQLLQPQEIAAEVAIRERCLEVLLHSADAVPARNASVELVRQTLADLEPESIERVKVWGRKSDDKEPAWSQEFGLDFGVYSMLLASSARDANSTPPAPSAETAQNRQIVKRQPSLYLAIGAIAAVVLVAAIAAFSQKLIDGFGQKNDTGGEGQTPTLPKQP